MTAFGALPPTPFDAAVDNINAGTQFYRVHSLPYAVTEFNPGVGKPSRFAFFGDPIVPVLYAADTDEAAVAESLLHDIPQVGGVLPYPVYKRALLGRITVTRPIRLAQLSGMGLRKLGITAADVTDTGADQYRRTVRWAAAAHSAGFDGLSWMSRQCNDTRAVVLFGDRCHGAVVSDPGYARMFRNPSDLGWLINLCDPLHVQVQPPTA